MLYASSDATQRPKYSRPMHGKGVCKIRMPESIHVSDPVNAVGRPRKATRLRSGEEEPGDKEPCRPIGSRVRAQERVCLRRRERCVLYCDRVFGELRHLDAQLEGSLKRRDTRVPRSPVGLATVGSSQGNRSHSSSLWGGSLLGWGTLFFRIADDRR